MDKERTATRPPHLDRLDIARGTNNAAPPSRRQNNVPPFTPGFAWNSTTQEFIEILPVGHPDYERNATIVAAAIKRWNGQTSCPTNEVTERPDRFAGHQHRRT